MPNQTLVRTVGDISKLLEELSSHIPLEKSLRLDDNFRQLQSDLHNIFQDEPFIVELDSFTPYRTPQDFNKELDYLRLHLIEVENSKEQTETKLFQKIEELECLACQNSELQKHLHEIQIKSIRMMQFFENKAKSAEERLLELSRELIKAHEISKKQSHFTEQMMQQERKKETLYKPSPEVQQHKVLQTKIDDLRNDLQRANNEINRLTLQLRKCEAEKVQAHNMYLNSQNMRTIMLKKLHKLREQQQQLDQTLTRNTSNWLAKEHQVKSLQGEIKWTLFLKMSSNIIWQIIRGNSSYRMKRNGHDFSREPSNLTGKNCFRYNGIIHKKTLGLEPEGTHLKLTMKRSHQFGRPAQQIVESKMKKGKKLGTRAVRNVITKNNYRRDLCQVALKRTKRIYNGHLKPSKIV